jgi:3-hydroxyanthranilate 3,4-dioxygenase
VDHIAAANINPAASAPIDYIGDLRCDFDHANRGEVSRRGYTVDMRITPPFDLHRWIDQNRELLKPPVGNKLLFKDSAFIVMAVGGPNSRKDFHHDPSEEFFFQVEGDMVLKTVQDGGFADVPIRQGQVFLLPPEVPHSPQRPAGSVGIVVERRRDADELDGFSWYCEKCANRLYMERVAVRDIETQLPEIFARFYSSVAHRTCSACGTVMQAPGT